MSSALSSANTVRASSNDTPCFLRFSAFLASSHSKRSSDTPGAYYIVVKTTRRDAVREVASGTHPPRVTAPGRVLAMEVMIPNAAIRNLIREDKVHQIYGQMQVGQEKSGMITLNQSLHGLYSRQLITLEEALGRSSEVEELEAMISGKSPVIGRSGIARVE